MFLKKTPGTIRTNLIVLIIFLILFGILSIIIFMTEISTPDNFPVNQKYTVKEGWTLKQTADELRIKHIIDSPLLFTLIVSATTGEGSIKSGTYQFSDPVSLSTVIRRITTADYGIPIFKITIPEGLTNSETASILKSKLLEFDLNIFESLSKKYEGYLFPDTYSFFSNAEAEEVFYKFLSNFMAQVSKISAEISSFRKPLHEIITMASILEKEARLISDRKIIAGILWKRIEIGMPLQVDAAFLYINGKSTYDLTLKDLNIDSPYNTYKYKGLPPTPISNPGLDSIIASVNPTITEYLYYLSDRNGKLYFSKTYDKHVINKKKYLN